MVAERVKLNDPGQVNGESSTVCSRQEMYDTTHQYYLHLAINQKRIGEIEVWVDGKSVIKATGLILRKSQESAIQGVHFQTFFGGASSHYSTNRL
jgi:Polysaccharide lyase 14